MIRSLQFKVLLGLSVVLSTVIGGYALFNINESSSKLKAESLLLHRVIVENSVPSIGLGLWNLDRGSQETSIRAIFKYGEIQEAVLVGDKDQKILAYAVKSPTGELQYVAEPSEADVLKKAETLKSKAPAPASSAAADVKHEFRAHPKTPPARSVVRAKLICNRAS